MVGEVVECLGLTARRSGSRISKYSVSAVVVRSGWAGSAEKNAVESSVSVI
jgi:hypothetical protein